LNEKYLSMSQGELATLARETFGNAVVHPERLTKEQLIEKLENADRFNELQKETDGFADGTQHSK